jgi:hypothetical protein
LAAASIANTNILHFNNTSTAGSAKPAGVNRRSQNRIPVKLFRAESATTPRPTKPFS